MWRNHESVRAEKSKCAANGRWEPNEIKTIDNKLIQFFVRLVLVRLLSALRFGIPFR